MQSGLSQGGVLDVAHSLRNLFKELGSADHGVGSTFAALGLVALVPAVCVLWFMTVAMRNERLAVQDRLTDVYLTHVASLQRQLIAFWEQRQAALSSLGRNAPAQRFAAVVRSNLADSAVVYDGSRKVIYPAPESIYASEEEENALILERELEFQKSDYPAAITAYERIAQSTQDPRLKARAIRS